MTKKFFKIAATVLGIAYALPLAGCFGKVQQQGSDSEKVLDIYIHKAGYDVVWLQEMKPVFLEQDWVKEKYGDDLTINITYNDVATYASDQIKGGSTFELYFGSNLRELYLEDYQRKPILEDLGSVFNAKVPGENITVKDKMLPSLVGACGLEQDGEMVYYSMPWAAGMNGIYYNTEILAKYNLSVPLTTDELITACDVITEGEGYAIMSSATGAPYWSYLYSIFWGQYAGYDKYREYWQGEVNGELGKTGTDVVEAQPGMLKSMEALEEILGNNHLVDTANSLLFMAAQTNFLTGRGAFMACGDWLDSEMRAERENRLALGQKLPELGLMRTPVISSIIERLSYRENGQPMSDEKLASVIREVDEGKTSSSLEGLSAEDFEIIREARSISHSASGGHNAVIPSYSPAKEIAKDFLLFLATDRANEVYTVSTCGAQLPFSIDLKTSNKELYDSLPKAGQMRYDFYSAPASTAAKILPYEGEFPLVIYSGYGALPGNSLTFEVYFGSTDKKSAASLYEAAKNYWTPQRWNMAIENAMLN